MQIPKILRNSALYSIVTLLQKCVSFFLLPLCTAFLSPEDYGTVNVVLSVSSFLSVLIMMSLNGAATRFHYKNTDENYRKVLWGTITTLVLINSLGWGIVFFTLHKFLVDPFIGEIDFYPYAVLALVNTVITPLYLLFQACLQARQEAFHYSVNTFLNFCTHIALTILFVVGLKLGAVGILLANVCTALIFFVYVLFAYLPHIKLGINKPITKKAYSYSLPLLPHHISIWSSGTIDKIFLNDIEGKASTGLYSVAQQFGQVVGTIAYSVNQAFVPWFFEMVEKGNDGIKKIQKMGNVMILAYCLIAFAISFFSPEILKIMVSEKFQSAWKVIPLVSYAFVFHGIYFFFINVLFLKDTGWVFTVTMAGMVFNIIANIILIPRFGYYGTGVACIITYLTRALFAMVLSIKKNKEIRYNYVLIFTMTFAFLALSYSCILFDHLPIMLSVLSKVFICAVFFAIFYLKYKTQLLMILKRRKK